ncbi:hypothetical protein CHS0354_030128 [Potamilus streckersoni]|uniref:Uncharacterized protein n=1 Tax=Potamilus streckersoni TaxID=2493646 RepID=A0AAE0STE0_9BIVA|nr:hypothetical protein CHS0354_030128 [Potamilus streckersoni]
MRSLLDMKDSLIQEVNENIQQIRLHIREFAPKTINEAESYAIRLEAHRLAERQRGNSLHQSAPHGSSVTVCQTLKQAAPDKKEEIDIKTLNESTKALNSTSKQLIKTLKRGNSEQNRFSNTRTNSWNGNQSYNKIYFMLDINTNLLRLTEIFSIKVLYQMLICMQSFLTELSCIKTHSIAKGWMDKPFLLLL